MEAALDPALTQLLGGESFLAKDGQGTLSLAEVVKEAPLCALDARLAELRVGHEELAVQVRGLHISRVREDHAPHAGGGELVGDDAAEASHTRDEHGRALEPLLPLLAEVGDPGLPLIGGALFFVERLRRDGELRQVSAARDRSRDKERGALARRRGL